MKDEFLSTCVVQNRLEFVSKKFGRPNLARSRFLHPPLTPFSSKIKIRLFQEVPPHQQCDQKKIAK